MKAHELFSLGIPRGAALRAAQAGLAAAAQAGLGKRELRERIQAVAADPAAHCQDEHFGLLATQLATLRAAPAAYRERAVPAPWLQWGTGLEPTALGQMEHAARLPVAVRGALMPDAHPGYGLPIGGVLATRDAVIPYAVGVDIACRMKMTVLDLPTSLLDRKSEKLSRALNDETRFGVGATFKERRQHPVLDADWICSPVTRLQKDKAWAQLGTSGSGNHFVEFGTLTLEQPALGLAAGVYLALLSHSGSRGTGAGVADFYSKLAMEQHPELPKELRHLAWLDLAGEAGQEYWRAMSLMGDYAAANHALIHAHIADHLGAQVLLDVENHHNFAWREIHDGEEVIVHRKGATPAGAGVLGIIPGSMGAPGYLVRGRGVAAALNSASHGAGRRMSRSAAVAKFNWQDVQRYLKSRRVTLISAGIDEAPMAYKDIAEVMAAQSDLVESLARFDPRLVKMAPAGERPED